MTLAQLVPTRFESKIILKNTTADTYHVQLENAGIGANKTWQFPATTASSLTFATISEGQTWTGLQTFGGGVNSTGSVESYGLTGGVTSANHARISHNAGISYFISFGGDATTAGIFNFVQRSSDAAVNITTASSTAAGAWNFSLSGQMTTVLGTFNVDQAATFDTTLGVTGVCTLGTYSDTPYTSYHNIYKNLIATPTASVDLNGTWLLGSNAYGAAGWMPSRQTGITGCMIGFYNRNSDTTVPCFVIQTNLTTHGATDASVSISTATAAGAWTWGPSAVATLQTINGASAQTSPCLLLGGANSSTTVPCPSLILNSKHASLYGMVGTIGTDTASSALVFGTNNGTTTSQVFGKVSLDTGAWNFPIGNVTIGSNTSSFGALNLNAVSGTTNSGQIAFQTAGVTKYYILSGTGYTGSGGSDTLIFANSAGTAGATMSQTMAWTFPVSIETGILITTKGALTIATDAVTVTKSYHTLAGEGAAADDLVTINGGTDGMRLVLRAVADAVTITVKSTGNIVLSGSDMALDNQYDTIGLIYDSALTKWLELYRSNNGA